MAKQQKLIILLCTVGVILISLGLLCIANYLYLGLAFLFWGCIGLCYGCYHHFSFYKITVFQILHILLSAVLIIGTLYFSIIEAQILRNAFHSADQDAEYIIVLGTATDDLSPSVALAERLEAAEKYLTEHPHCIAILSGGNEYNYAISEADCMYEWLISRGISESRLIKENQSTSTMENLVFSKQMIFQQSASETAAIGIVTSDYHVCRGVYLAKSLGLDVFGIPAKTHAPLYALNNYIREVFGMTYYYVFGVESK